MREIGKISNELDASTFRDFLYNRGIGCDIESDSRGNWTVWVEDEDRMEEAENLLQSFLQNPSDPEYVKGADGAEIRRQEKQREDQEFAKTLRTRADIFQAYGFAGIGKITIVLMALSIAVTLICSFDNSNQVSGQLSIAETFVVPGQGSAYFKHLKEVRDGQIWRLITPVFIHASVLVSFGFIHILFNMMWLRDLGSTVEKLRGGRFYILFFLLVSALSNIGQFYVSGPNFGGMSGVVFGLLGYAWMQSRFNPWSGFVLHSTTVQMMLVWFFLCLSGAVGNIANTAHAVGLVVGICWGFIDAKRRIPE